MLLTSLLAALQEAAGGSPQAPASPPRSASPFGMNDMMIMLGAFVVIFYFFMWRPQAKERRQREAMFKALKKGDRVLLSCGLVGQIAALTEQDVLIRFDDKDPRRLRFRRYAIQGVLASEEEPAAEPVEAQAK
jgi:preprotein translocase subunit YajC